MADILHQAGRFTVRKAAHGKGYEVYEEGPVAAERRASIGEGPGPHLGIQRAIAEAERRHAAGSSSTAARAAAMRRG